MKIISISSLLEKIIYRIYSFFYKKGLVKTSIFFKYLISSLLYFLFKKKYRFISKLTNWRDFDKKFVINKSSFIDFSKIYKAYNSELKFYSKILSVGPSSNYLKDIKEFKPDLVVLNKITLESIESKIPHIFILNNSWSQKNKTLIKKVLQRKKNSFIFTPLGQYETSIYPEFLNLFNCNNLGISPMGLQRLLIILPSLIKFDNLILRGYNFGLSDTPYLCWYPSLVKENWGSIKKGLLFSYMRHSLPFNVNLTRQIISYLSRNENIKLDCEEIIDVINKPIYEILDEFKIRTKS